MIKEVLLEGSYEEAVDACIRYCLELSEPEPK
jgi:hypothetical protein